MSHMNCEGCHPEIFSECKEVVYMNVKPAYILGAGPYNPPVHEVPFSYKTSYILSMLTGYSVGVIYLVILNLPRPTGYKRENVILYPPLVTELRVEVR